MRMTSMQLEPKIFNGMVRRNYRPSATNGMMYMNEIEIVYPSTLENLVPYK